MSDLLMTQSDYAVHQGVTEGAVSKWKAKGLLVWADDPDRRGRQLVDVEASDQLIAQERDPTRGRPTSGTPDLLSGEKAAGASVPRLDEAGLARLDNLRAQTTRRNLENDRLAGGLVAREEYEARAADFGRAARERVVGLYRQHGERLAAERDPRAIIVFLTNETDKVFTALADDIEAGRIEGPAGAATDPEAAGAVLTESPE